MVLLGGGVAFLTNIEAIVIEPALLPPGGGMAVGTLPLVMFSRTVLPVTGHTIVETGMIKGDHCPVGGVVMTIRTGGRCLLGQDGV